MHDEMMAGKSEAYYDGNAKQSEPPRFAMELELLDKQIEIVARTAQELHSRLDPMMQPEHDADVRAMDGTPMREPSKHTARLIASQRRVQQVTAQLQDALDRLEI